MLTSRKAPFTPPQVSNDVAGSLRRRILRFFAFDGPARPRRSFRPMLEMLEDRTTPSSISGLSPAFGPTAGDGTVYIYGSGFTGATAVSFGGVATLNFMVESGGTEIAAEVPPHAAGVVDTVVTAPSGVSPITTADQYTYQAPPPPAVTQVSPATGSTAGGAYVEIFGSGFVSGATSVSFGGIAAPMVDVLNGGGALYADTPAGSAGTVDVTVTTANGTSAVVTADQYTYEAPPPASTTTYLYPSSYTPTYGQSVTLTASVYNGGQSYPTGQVEFLDGGDVIGTGTLSNGQASLTLSSLTVGGHSLTAAYQGDASDAVSTSYAANVTVQQASTTTALTSSANPSDIGQAVTFTAEVDGASGGAPTGSITFMSGTTTLGTGTLSPGGNGSQATLTLSTLPTGTDPVVAVYGGDPNYRGSSSSTLNQVVENNGAFVWTGDVSEDWDVAGNWMVNGQTATTDPGDNADVIFSGVGETDPNCCTDGAVTVNSLTLDCALHRHAHAPWLADRDGRIRHGRRQHQPDRRLGGVRHHGAWILRLECRHPEPW